jgi:polyphosphate:AMP phosphotransferase
MRNRAASAGLLYRSPAMFETAELGRSVEKAEYEARLPALRTDLLKLQRELEPANVPVIVLLNGVDGGGKGEVLNTLHEWLDTRDLVTHAFGPPTDEERQRPEFWRYWMALPPHGKIAVLPGNWYTEAIVGRVYRRIKRRRLELMITRINAFEQTLIDEGALVIKFWLHISKRDQRRRLKKLEKSRATRWRVTDLDWEHHGLYGRFKQISARVLSETSTGESPWTVIEGTDERYRNLAIGEHLLERLRERLRSATARPKPRALDPNVPDPETVLDRLDLGKKLEKERYDEALELFQGRLNLLSRKLAERQKSAILVFEGWDAAGKGGVIRRIVQALDARQYRVIPIAAPTEEEKSHHYLWRFWRQLPRLGRFTIYDRSWYGRVLVERVEGFANEREGMRAYKEINDFEEQLVEHGAILVKFWLHISREEQMRRFEARQKEPWKFHKITQEDFRNREKWNLYEGAANEMLARTSTELAPWTLIEAEDKRYARVKAIGGVCSALEKTL